MTAQGTPKRRKRDLPRAERRALARARREAERWRIFLSCAPGLEPWLAAEVQERALGAPSEVVGGVELEGDRAVLYRACLELGLASHARVRMGRFYAAHFSELVRRASELPWERWLGSNTPLRLRSSASRSRLHHTTAIDERVREAISTRLGAAPPEAQGEDDGMLVLARLERDVVTLSIDPCGAPLHRRGYRLETGKAPLREDLACALVRVSGWDRESPLLDPMAGSGTIAIEAAGLARGLAPGRGRSFAFESAPEHDAVSWAALRAAAQEQARSGGPPIVARDRDEGVVAQARRNAARAEVALEHVVGPLSAPFAVRSFEAGALVTNPPWGRRVGSDGDLRPLYHALAKVMQGLPPTWALGLAASDARLVRAAGLPLSSQLLTDAGGIKVRLYRRQSG